MRPTAAVTAQGPPLLVVTEVGARLVRRGLLAPPEAAAGGWVGARVLVFRHGPVMWERSPAALTLLRAAPTF